MFLNYEKAINEELIEDDQETGLQELVGAQRELVGAQTVLVGAE